MMMSSLLKPEDLCHYLTTHSAKREIMDTKVRTMRWLCDMYVKNVILFATNTSWTEDFIKHLTELWGMNVWHGNPCGDATQKFLCIKHQSNKPTISTYISCVISVCFSYSSQELWFLRKSTGIWKFRHGTLDKLSLVLICKQRQWAENMTTIPHLQAEQTQDNYCRWSSWRHVFD